jgi:hypothetical protein
MNYSINFGLEMNNEVKTNELIPSGQKERNILNPGQGFSLAEMRRDKG